VTQYATVAIACDTIATLEAGCLASYDLVLSIADVIDFEHFNSSLSMVLVVWLQEWL
jgi:hypothetical protein